MATAREYAQSIMKTAEQLQNWYAEHPERDDMRLQLSQTYSEFGRLADDIMDTPIAEQDRIYGQPE